MKGGEYISEFNVKPFLSFLEQSVKLLKERFKEKDGNAFVIEKPLIYLNKKDTLFSIGISTYINNSKNSDLPCTGCEGLQDNQIWKSRNRAIFNIDQSKNELVFRNWEN